MLRDYEGAFPDRQLVDEIGLAIRHPPAHPAAAGRLAAKAPTYRAIGPVFHVQVGWAFSSRFWRSAPRSS